MVIWHLTSDAPRFPFFVSAGQNVNLQVGTWPIAPGQRIWIDYRVMHPDGTEEAGHIEGTWNVNRETNSYWFLNFGPFADGDRVAYWLRGSSPTGPSDGETFSFVVSPKLHLAILWHQHQPLYKNLQAKRPQGSYRFPWVRLHALRDYYAMAAMLESYPDVHLTISLTPVLLWQIEDYATRGATDQALDLTLMAAARLSAAQREELLSTFFEADWHTQIYPWPRYRELFEQRRDGKPFTTQDLIDLQMWFNLAWFAPEFQGGTVPLPDGEAVSVADLIQQDRGFTVTQIKQMVGKQLTIMRQVVAIHCRLQDCGQIEISTTPFYHPILPLLVDTDRATIDRDGATHPRRFHRPEDATAQVHQAVTFYQERFGHPPAGMWPAEGAVGQSVVALFAEAGIHWIATDRGVLERSGQYGYNVRDPNVLCQAYRAEDEAGQSVAVFFRDTVLSDQIGFHYQHYADPGEAAADFMRELKERFAWQMNDPPNQIVSIILDGENAWGAYPQQARPFLRALYAALASDSEIRTVTFREYLEGNPIRRVPAHPLVALPRVYDLFEASWIDENGSRPGNDLGTWIGEAEENHAWDLLRETRDWLDQTKTTPRRRSRAFDCLYAAEGSDWFWWFGDDQTSDSDADFDDLFRQHLANVYRAAGQTPPVTLTQPIVPHTLIWTFARPIAAIRPEDRLTIRTNCAGRLLWRIDSNEPWQTDEMIPAGGVMAAVHRFGMTLGPFPSSVRVVEFRFQCAHPECCGTDPCCRGELRRVDILEDPSGGTSLGPQRTKRGQASQPR